MIDIVLILARVLAGVYSVHLLQKDRKGEIILAVLVLLYLVFSKV